MMNEIRKWFALLLFSLSIQLSPLEAQSPQKTPSYLPDRIIVKFQAGIYSPEKSLSTLPTSLQLALEQAGVRQIQHIFPFLRETKVQSRSSESTTNLTDIYTLHLQKGNTVEKALKFLNAEKEILFAEPFYEYELFYQPNDVLADSSEGSRNWQWYLDNTRVRQAWDLQRNDTSVLIAYVDAGFSFKHPDLQDNLALNYDDPPDGIDNDDDGFIDNYRGWDFGGVIKNGVGDNDPSWDPTLPGQNHGISVAGLSSATADNEEGIAGISFNAKYLPIKGSSDESPAFITYGYQGILYAVAQGADIVNCSWGGTVRSQFGHEVVKYAVSQGVAVVAACGNTGKQDMFYPAAYPEVISVANTNIRDELLQGIPGGSTYDYSVNVSAPGSFVYGPINDRGYNGNTGTSFSAPITAGAIALVKGYFPQYTGYQAGQRIRVTTDPVDSIQPASYAGKVGSGRVNVLRALTDPPKPSIRLRDWVLSSSAGTNVLRQADTAYLQASWKNHLEIANDLVVRVEEVGDSLISKWITNEWQAGTVSAQQIISSSDPGFSFVLSDSISSNQTLVLKLTYLDEASGYADVEYVSVLVNPPFLPVRATQLETIVSAQANWGYYSTVDDRFGDGFVFRSQQNALAEGGFLIGKSATTLSDNIRNINFRDRDFNILQNIAEENQENLASFQASSLFSDSLATSPLGLIIQQRVYTFPELPSSILLSYTLTNPKAEPLDSLYAGLFADWDISPSFSLNSAIIDSSRKVAFSQYPTSNIFSHYGISLLSEQNFHAYNAAIGEFAFSKEGKFQALSASIGGTPMVLEDKDVAQFVSAGPFSLNQRADRTLFFGLIAGQTEVEFYQELTALQALYSCYFLENPFPENFLYTPEQPILGETLSLKDPNTQFSERSWFVNGGKISEADSTTFILDGGGEYKIKLISGNESCQFTDERELEALIVTSLQEGQERLFQVYPNPVTKRLRVEGLSLKGSYRLSTLVGEEILAGKLETGNSEIDLSRVATGVYLLQITSAGKSETHKILKN